MRSRAALIGESTEVVTEGAPSADPERAALENRAALADVVGAVLSNRAPTGATAELQTELGLDGNQAPLALFRTAEHRAALEVRTTGQTSAPTDTGASQAPIIDAVFPMGAATWLGVDMPTVPAGDSTYTVLSTSFVAGTPGGGAEQADTAAAFTATVVSPSRIQASGHFRIEDRARLAGMEESLRRNLTDAMADKLDSTVIAKFLASGTLDDAPAADAGATATFGIYRAILFGEVDGIYATTASQIRMLLGVETYAHASASYRGNADNTDALAAINRDSGGSRVSAHIPDPATLDQSLIVVRGPAMRHAVAPIWDSVEIITDPYTQSKSGEVRLTAVMLWGGLNVVRKAGYSHRKVQAG